MKLVNRSTTMIRSVMNGRSKTKSASTNRTGTTMSMWQTTWLLIQAAPSNRFRRNTGKWTATRSSIECWNMLSKVERPERSSFESRSTPMSNSRRATGKFMIERFDCGLCWRLAILTWPTSKQAKSGRRISSKSTESDPKISQRSPQPAARDEKLIDEEAVSFPPNWLIGSQRSSHSLKTLNQSFSEKHFERMMKIRPIFWCLTREP